MKAMIISEESYEDLKRKIEHILEQLKEQKLDPDQKILDNLKLQEELSISPRLAQQWRNDGTIGYSQIGNKIYYKLSDVIKMLDSHYHPSTKKKIMSPDISVYR